MALKFITFEGGEGTGKSTQARLLAERLKAAGEDVVVTREPGGAPLAEDIRTLILKQKPHSADAEFLLFAAARAEHIAVTIKPALERGAFVICDRYIHSTRVYQGALGRVDPELIATIEELTVAPVLPALTLVLDLAPETGLARARERGGLNHYDQNEVAWHNRLREAFLQEAMVGDPDRCRIIDAARPPDEIAAEVWGQVAAAFGLKGG